MLIEAFFLCVFCCSIGAESRGRGTSVTNQSVKKSSQCLTNQVKPEVDEECNGNISSSAGGNVRKSAPMDCKYFFSFLKY